MIRPHRDHRALQRSSTVADFVLARVRAKSSSPVRELEAGPRTPADKYRVLATLREAAFGLEDAQGVARWRVQAEAAATARWMLDDSTLPQLAKLQELLSASPLSALSY